MLSMPDWLCGRLMEAEISSKADAGKNEHSEARTGYRSGYRARRGTKGSDLHI
jgi:transposase-like protein